MQKRPNVIRKWPFDNNLFCHFPLFQFFFISSIPFFFPADPRHVPLFVTLLISHRNEPLRLKILKLMADIIKSPSVPDGNRSYWHLRSIGFSAVTEQLKDDISQPLVESLLRLGVSEHDENKGVDVLIHYHVVLAVLEVIENGGLEMKRFASHMVNNLLSF